ncbi:MAG: hypothetical protein H6679_03990 [Epsilonproteobacteria bacterium]|nr:hypothetical protein [Campylobacterota bacterium]
MSYRFFYIFLFCFVRCLALQQHTSRSVILPDFIQSFIKHYEFSPEGRFTHEYHPYLLQNTSVSLDELEHSLVDNGLHLFGRMIICGYEEQAVPSYYTDYTRAKINDEARLHSKADWSMKLHNRFGIMTGFLFKDINELSQRFIKDKEPLFYHIDPTALTVFRDQATVFQEHAFGQALPLMHKARDTLLAHSLKGKCKEVFKNLIAFWHTMYTSALKVGNKQIAGTQDILFSIEYGKHLLRSELPLLKFFLGPDITYPIEVSCKQKRGATIHAQHFVSEFVKKLQSRNGQNTVYVFCSFVDGVGKSTMLGNIKNWMRFGSDIDQFEHVDNSSSQLSEVFKYADKVFIADLPAQVSHFTYKPDGYVYVDVQTNLPYAKITELEQYVLCNIGQLKQEYDRLYKRVEQVIAEQGFQAPQLNDAASASSSFVKNLFLLKRHVGNNWIPFHHKDNFYLFNQDRPSEIRGLTPLGQTKSEGLKNIEAEQMLFFAGIKMPCSYSFFVDDFIKKLKQYDIKEVVFVDFVSMYPRSSRENVRINYLLQQLALLNPSFDPLFSSYATFINGGQLLHCLLDHKKLEKFFDSLYQESMLRFFLYQYIMNNDVNYVQSVSPAMLNDYCLKKLNDVQQDNVNYVHNACRKKILEERNNLQKLFAKTKSFVNIFEFSFNRVLALSDVFSSFFNAYVNHESLAKAWQQCGDVNVTGASNFEQGSCDYQANLTHGQGVKVLYRFFPECKSELLLTPFMSSIRSCWYAALSNLAFTKVNADGLYEFEKHLWPVVPLLMTKGTDGNVYVVQRLYDLCTSSISKKIKKAFKNFNLRTFKPKDFAVIDDELLRLNWNVKQTSSGIFAYDCDLATLRSKAGNDSMMFGPMGKQSVVSLLVQKHQNENGPDAVVTANRLGKYLNESQFWKIEARNMYQEATKNGLNPSCDQNSDDSDESNNSGFFDDAESVGFLGANPGFGMQNENNTKEKLYVMRDDQKYTMQLLARMLCTIDMVIKDIDSNIVIRWCNKKDFKAALKLFEKITMPRYFNLLCKDELFEDYDTVEPYPSWEYWEKIGQ